MRDIRAIRSEADYDWALAEIEPYFLDEPEPGSAEGQRFDVLTDLIEAYEARHWPIEPADPIETIEYKMEMSGLDRSDLAALLGSAPRASEILNRKRALTIAMIRRLNRDWGIPAECLIRPYRLEAG